MDAGVADTLNRHFAQIVCGYLDAHDTELHEETAGLRWFYRPIADTLASQEPDKNSDRAWLVGFLAARTPGVDFDGQPQDCDWNNLFSHFRAEILARRDPQAPSVRDMTPCGMV